MPPGPPRRLIGLVAQLVERHLDTVEARGSTPFGSTWRLLSPAVCVGPSRRITDESSCGATGLRLPQHYRANNADVAQMVERQISNLNVAGSRPVFRSGPNTPRRRRTSGRGSMSGLRVAAPAPVRVRIKHGQAVRSWANPGRTFRAGSSTGRAPRSQRGGRGFDSLPVHARYAAGPLSPAWSQVAVERMAQTPRRRDRRAEGHGPSSSTRLDGDIWRHAVMCSFHAS